MVIGDKDFVTRRMGWRRVYPKKAHSEYQDLNWLVKWICRGKIYWPDGADNHRVSGANVGHVDWVRRGDYIYRCEMSQDEGRTGIAIPWL